jgi:hypothetical protein
MAGFWNIVLILGRIGRVVSIVVKLIWWSRGLNEE